MLSASGVRKIIALAFVAAACFTPWRGVLAQEDTAAAKAGTEAAQAAAGEKTDVPKTGGASLAEAIEDIDRALSAAEEKKPPKQEEQALKKEEHKEEKQEQSARNEEALPEHGASGISLDADLAFALLALLLSVGALGAALYRHFRKGKEAEEGQGEAKARAASSGKSASPETEGFLGDEPLMSFDGDILNKEQAAAEKLMDVFSAEPVPEYEAVSGLFSSALREKFTQAKYEVFEKHVKEKFGDMKEVKFIAFERLDQIDRLTYFANFTKERLVVIRMGFTKEGKVESFQLNPYKKQPENRRLGGSV